MNELPTALKAWEAWPQFILWKRENRDGKLAKVPIDHRTTRPGSVTDPAIYMSAANAFKMASMYGGEYGVGFCFTEKDPFFFIDIDGGFQGGEWSEVTKEISGQFVQAAQEISQSNTGLHIFGTYRTLIAHSNKNAALDIELYTSGRFVALTGRSMSGAVESDCSVALTNITAKYFPPTSMVVTQDWTDEPVKHWDGVTDDAELIKRACASKSARAMFGGGATFKDLWEANEDALGKAYPDEHGARPFDNSSADGALAFHLAFWTGNDCERILRLMLQSALHRQKWDDRLEDYLKARTIMGACAGQTQAYNLSHNKIKEAPKSDMVTAAELRAGWQWLTPDMQLDVFKGCVYIIELNRIFTPSGDILKADQFNGKYGGYVFAMDDSGKGKSTKPFDAFTQSQAVTFPKADAGMFVPTEAPGSIMKINGRAYVNTYVPINTPRKEGDASPFLVYLAKLLPDANDRSILLSYMAAIIQYPGVKFQWAPVIQGTKGNGKTLLTRCVCYAIGMEQCHLPVASEIAERFNSWLFDKIFIGVEEMHVPEGRLSVLAILNTMITNADMPMRGMHREQKMQRNVANFILNSNWKDAVPKDKNDRRFCVFFTAQQSIEDLERDGMLDDYFPNLYNWLKADGYAIVTNYLHTYAIPDELNPAKDCQRAPITSTTGDAIAASLGRAEQEVLEAVEEGRYGFRGDWISSSPLNTLFEEKNLTSAVPPNKRRDMLKTLGYDWHPTLNKGRATQFIHMDGGKKSILYIRDGHASRNLELPSAVVKAYEAAQQETMSNTVPSPIEVFQGPQP